MFTGVIHPQNSWEPVNDTVMGGCSHAHAAYICSESLYIHGNVSLENGGGFASVRTQCHGCPPLDPSEIGEVAVMIKDRQDGPFALLVSDIAGFRMPQPVEQQWMEEALDTADHSGTPYGAVIVGADGQMLSKAGNRVGADNDASAHAEIRAIGKPG